MTTVPAVSRALSIVARPVQENAPETPAVRQVPVSLSGDGPERVTATPTPPPPAPKPERVAARPVMAQSASSPVPVPPAAVPVSASQKTSLSVSEANTILSGLQVTISMADNANKTGWKCESASDAVFYQGRVLRDRLAQFVAGAKTGATFDITKDELDAADKILACSAEATGTTQNTSAYVALGAILIGAAIFLSVA